MEVDLKQFGKYRLDSEIEIAIINGDLECIGRYMKEGWQVNQLIRLDENIVVTPVVLAIINHDYATLEFLMKNKADLDYRNCHAFLYAVRCCDKDMIRHVASLGAKIDARYSAGVGAYELACEYSDENKIEIYELFVELGLKLEMHAGQALIMEVNEDLEVVEYLLANGVEADTADQMFPGGRMTAMVYAIMHGNLEAVSLLIAYGADLSLKSSIGTPYEIAVEQGQMEIAGYIKDMMNIRAEEPVPESFNIKEEIQELWNMGKKISMPKFEMCIGY